MLTRKEVEAYLTGNRSTSKTADGKGIKRAPRTDAVSKAVLDALQRNVPLTETKRNRFSDTELDAIIRTNTVGLIIESITSKDANGDPLIEKARVDGAASRQYFTVKYVCAEPGAFPDRAFTRNIFQGYADPVTRQQPTWFKHSSPEMYKTWMDNNTVIKGAIMTANVEPYATSPRKDRDGNEFIPTVDTFTAVVLPGENPQNVFEQTFNHPLAKPTISREVDQTSLANSDFGGKF